MAHVIRKIDSINLLTPGTWAKYDDNTIAFKDANGHTLLVKRFAIKQDGSGNQGFDISHKGVANPCVWCRNCGEHWWPVFAGWKDWATN
jgi:hypothetical protein